MKVALKDGAPRSAGVVEINVSKNGNTLEIGAVGVEPFPIVLEFYSGKLTLRLFGDDGQPTVVQQVKLAPAPAATVESLLTKAIGYPPVSVTHAQTAQEAVNSVFTPPAPAADQFDEAAFDAA